KIHGRWAARTGHSRRKGVEKSRPPPDKSEGPGLPARSPGACRSVPRPDRGDHPDPQDGSKSEDALTAQNGLCYVGSPMPRRLASRAHAAAKLSRKIETRAAHLGVIGL